jgi:hypothetical protein
MSRLTLERAFTSHAGLAHPSPLQCAICRAAEGRPLGGVLDPNSLREYFGVSTETALAIAPKIVVAACGVRSAKTTLGCADCIVTTFESDLSALREGERARAVIVGPHAKATDHTFNILLSMFDAHPALRKTIIDRRESERVLVVKRPKDGRIVEIMAVAPNASGVTLRGAWLTFFMLEETASFYSEIGGYKVHAEELLRAAEPRLVPGGRGWIIGSPRGPEGLLYDLYRSHFGKPGRVLVVHAPTAAMNPRFDVREIEALRERDPDSAAREFDAAWIDAESTYFTQTEIDACTRHEPLEISPEPRWAYAAVSDPATRSNGCPFLIVGAQRQHDGTLRLKVVWAREWRGSQQKPLSMSMVLAELMPVLRRYGITTIYGDQHSSDVLADLAAHYGFRWVRIYVSGNASRTTAPSGVRNRSAMFEELKAMLTTRAIELPPIKLLRQDLLGVKRRVTPTGLAYDYTHTPDGRHGDFAAALLMAVTIWPGRDERLEIEAKRAHVATVMAQFNNAGALVANEPGAWARERHALRLEQPMTREAMAANAFAVEEHRLAAAQANAIAERNTDER